MILPVHPAPGPASTPPVLSLGLAALGVRGAMYPVRTRVAPMYNARNHPTLPATSGA